MLASNLILPMKNYKVLFAAGALALMTATGCSSDFLDLAPISQQNSNNFYKTPEDMKNALTAVYGSLQYGGQYYSSLHIIGELRSDNTEITNPAAGARRSSTTGRKRSGAPGMPAAPARPPCRRRPGPPIARCR